MRFDNNSRSSLETSPKILLVDDDSDLRVIVREILEMEGYSVVEASNCRVALDLIRQATFDLVLLDITLPDDSGLKVLEIAKQIRPSMSVIMMTGTTGLDNALQSLKLGAEDYIAKPFNDNYLIKAIEHVLSVKHTKEGLQNS